MPYYTPTGNPVSNARGTSDTIRAEFVLIQAAFTAMGVPGSSALGTPYKWSASTTGADPGPGYLRLNNATLASATASYIDNANSSGVTVSALLDLMALSTNPAKALLRLTKLADTTQWVLFKVTACVDSTGYRTTTMTYVSGAATFVADEAIQLEISVIGDKGDTGATGASVAPLIYTPRTTNTILGAADFAAATRKFIDVTSGTFTQTFAAAATIGADQWLIYRNSGTGDVTLSATSIDGLASYIMYPGEVRMIQCDGTNLKSVVLHGFAKTFTASSTFTKPPGYVGTFDGLLWGGGGTGARTSGNNLSGGSGGACVPFSIPVASFGVTEVITIGALAAGPAVDGAGVAGNPSSIGSMLTAFGGSAGTVNSTAPGGAGTMSVAAAGVGGAPAGGAANIDSAFGGGGGGTVDLGAAGKSFYGGGGAGMGTASGSGLGGDSQYGGGGGGGINNTTARAGGQSKFGGNGGASANSTSGVDGSAPAGGGGATRTGTKAGDGARGELRIRGSV